MTDLMCYSGKKVFIKIKDSITLATLFFKNADIVEVGPFHITLMDSKEGILKTYLLTDVVEIREES